MLPCNKILADCVTSIAIINESLEDTDYVYGTESADIRKLLEVIKSLILKLAI